MDARRVTKRWVLGGVAAVVLGAAGWQAVSALQDQQPQAPATPRAAAEALPTEKVEQVDAPAVAGTTPMADRVAVIGVLNKRNGISRDLTMKPGQALRLGDVIVRLRACEKTAPWEPEQLTGAFVQVDVKDAKDKWGRVFSGWLFKESPSLNVVEHPVYDVWAKACTMNFPDTGPDTVVSEAASSAPRKASAARESSAEKSGEEATPEPPTNAESSNAM